MNSKPKQSAHILVLGGGYAGLLAAGCLRRELPYARITLVDEQANFSHRVRRHEELVGHTIDTINYQQFALERKIDFLQARVEKLDPDTNSVHLSAGAASLNIEYDQLVYALGSVSRPLWQGRMPDNTYTLNNPTELLAAQQGLVKAKRLLVIGAGLSAIEYATEIAESFPSIQIKLLTRSCLLSGYSLAAKNYARSTMMAMGIELVEHTEIVSVEDGYCTNASGESMPFDLCLSSAGFAASPVWRNSGLPSRDNGQIDVDEAMRAASYENIWVAGDAAYGEENGLASMRMSCASACATAPSMAQNIARQQRSEAPVAHTPYYFAHCISLGREKALIQMVTPDDKMLPEIVTGEFAVATKTQISAAVMSTLLWDGHASQQGWWPDFEQLLKAAA